MKIYDNTYVMIARTFGVIYYISKIHGFVRSFATLSLLADLGVYVFLWLRMGTSFTPILNITLQKRCALGEF